MNRSKSHDVECARLWAGYRAECRHRVGVIIREQVAFEGFLSENGTFASFQAARIDALLILARQRPPKRGSRFSTNASAASRWSSVSPVCR